MKKEMSQDCVFKDPHFAGGPDQNGTVDEDFPDVPRSHVGIGGAPTRPIIMPRDAAERKRVPLATGLFDYFPDALIAIAAVSWAGNEQHNPGKPLHWDRSKSKDESDTMLRHFAERGTFDAVDGIRHSAKMAWRALAILQKEIEADRAARKFTLDPTQF